MPNWCMNDVSMHGSKEHMKLFLSEFCDEDPNGTGMYRLVYQKISPVGEFEKDETNFNQIQAQSAAWGCKWDMSDYAFAIEEETWNDKEYINLEGSYDTPWGPPMGFLEKVSKDWSSLTFEIQYEEPGMGFAGRTTYQEGEVTAEEDWEIEYDEDEEDCDE